MDKVNTITADELNQKLQGEAPNNEDKAQGYALVNVLGAEAFNEAHIKGSINVTRGNEDEFEAKFDKDKEIVVYCSSPNCQASPAVAEELIKRGFTNVTDYEDGMSVWQEKGFAVESGTAEKGESDGTCAVCSI